MLTSVTQLGLIEKAVKILPGDAFEYRDIVYVAVNMVEQDSSLDNTTFPKEDLFGVDLRDGRINRIDAEKFVLRIGDVRLYRN